MRYVYCFLLFIISLSCINRDSEIHGFEKVTVKDSVRGIETFGEKLFFDTRLSLDNSVSCGSCHKPKLAFADTVSLSKGVKDRLGFRNTPSLLNLDVKPLLMLDGAVPNLEMQAIVPIQDHNEMSISMGDLIKKLGKDKEYNDLSNKFFQREFDAFVLTRAIAAYIRSLISRNSDFDMYMKDPIKHPLSDGEQRGWILFNRKRCIECHSLPDFTNYKISASGFNHDPLDPGRYRITGDSLDIGKFVVPSLRNVQVTYPYLHNGSIRSVEEVILTHYDELENQLNKAYPSVDQFDANFIARFLVSLTSYE